MYTVNPETNRPIKIGSRVYKTLVKRGVLCPDDTLSPPKLTRSKRLTRYEAEKLQPKKKLEVLQEEEEEEEAVEELKEQKVKKEEQEDKTAEVEQIAKPESEEDDDEEYEDYVDQEDVEEELYEEDPELMKRVAQCAAKSVNNGHFDGLTEKEITLRLKELIIEALGN